VSRALAPLVVLTLVVVAVQISILTSLRLSGVVVMLVWLWPLCIGLAGFTSLSIVAGVIAGFFFDTHGSTPVGLSALVAVALALGASRLGREGVGDLDSAAWWVTPLVCGIGGFVAPLLFVVSGFFALDFTLWRGSLIAAMLVNALAFFVFARPVARVARAVGRLGERARR
jgi:hypothetical protein